MLLTTARLVADDTNPDTTAAGIRAAILLALLLGTGYWFYRRTTQGSRTLAAAIRKRGMEPGQPVAPPPVVFGDREASVGTMVDLAAVTAGCPGFTALGMLSIARETFSLVRKARSEQIPQLADRLLSPALRAQLDSSIAGDAEAHRHHLFPMLDIAGAAIVDSAIEDAGAVVTVRFDLTGTEVERSDETGDLVAGAEHAARWDERWTFHRPRDAATAEQDRIMTQTAGGWMIPHQGWVVTTIFAGEPVAMDGDAPTLPAAPLPGNAVAEPASPDS